MVTVVITFFSQSRGLFAAKMQQPLLMVAQVSNPSRINTRLSILWMLLTAASFT